MPKQYGGPGPRLMYPSAALSLSLARCDALGQLLFDRMVTQADDQGRMIADPDVVRGACIPLVKEASAAKVARWLDQLEAQEMIVRYEAEGHHLLQILNWWSYQNSMRRAYPSRWEAPAEWEDRVFGLPSNAGNGTAPTPPQRRPRARKMPAEIPHSAEPESANGRDVPAQIPQSAERPRARRDAGGEPNRRYYVPITELPPQPPSPGGGESGDLLADYRGCLGVLSEATGMPWREEALSRTAYLDRRREGFSALDLDDAARGVALDPWFMGRNADGIPRCNPTAVLRSQKFQTFIGLARGQITARGTGPAQFDAFADALEAEALEAGTEPPLRLVEGESA